MIAEFIELSLTIDLTQENFPTLSQEELDAAIQRQNLISNKVSVAIYFTNKLGTLTNIADIENPENTFAYLASIEVLSDITTDDTTVSTAINKLLNLIGNSSAIDSIFNNWSELDTDIGIEISSLFDKCTGCHGSNGENSAFGKSGIIGGKSSQSLISSLMGYKEDGLNKYGLGGIMQGAIEEYSFDEIETLSKYINTLNSDD